MQRYVTRYAYAFCYQRVLCAYCNQEIRSVNDALVYLKSRSEKLFPLTRGCFQLLLTVRPITRNMSQSSSSSMTDCSSLYVKKHYSCPTVT